MRFAILSGLSLLALTTVVQAQSAPINFEQAAKITCREAQAMAPEQRKQLAAFLAEQSAAQRGVVIPNDERGGELALMVRGGCTLEPDTSLYSVIDREIMAERDNLPKPQ